MISVRPVNTLAKTMAVSTASVPLFVKNERDPGDATRRLDLLGRYVQGRGVTDSTQLLGHCPDHPRVTVSDRGRENPGEEI
ncbi:MAG: hypothetical protein OXI46_08255 [Gemmatimonadota bacterium]|nr:hypothetical protein [Gemmatimonadota bacterium]